MPLKIKQRLYQKHVAYKLNYVHLHCMQLLHLAHGRIQVEGYQPATLTRWILMGSIRSCAFIISDRNPTFLGFSLTQGDDSSLPVCSVSCTVHLQLFTNNDILWLGQNQLIINKYAVLSRYSLWPIKLVKD